MVDHSTTDWSSPVESSARLWVRDNGPALLAEINERFEHWFLEEEDGWQTARSDYGTIYSSHTLIVGAYAADNVTSPGDLLRETFLDYVEREIEKLRCGSPFDASSVNSVIVWRVRPMFEADSERELVKLRFRAHGVTYERHMARHVPPTSVHPAAGREPHDIGWAIRQLEAGHSVRHPSSPFVWWNADAMFHVDDIAATDWELAD